MNQDPAGSINQQKRRAKISWNRPKRWKLQHERPDQNHSAVHLKTNRGCCVKKKWRRPYQKKREFRGKWFRFRQALNCSRDPEYAANRVLGGISPLAREHWPWLSSQSRNMSCAGFGSPSFPSFCRFVQRESPKRKAEEISRSESEAFSCLTYKTTSQENAKQLLEIITDSSDSKSWL